MNALLALLALAPAQQPATLSFETNAAPLKSVVAQVGQQAGLKLKVHDDLAQEPVIVRLVDVPVQEALDKIATTVQAEWKVQEDGTRLLHRSQLLVEKLENEAFARRVDRFERGLAKARENLSGRFDSRAAEQLGQQLRAALMVDPERRRNIAYSAQFRALRDQAPLYRLAYRIAGCFTGEMLAQLPEGKQLVFSNKPNPAQYRLEGFDPQWLHELHSEMRLLASYVAELKEDPYGRRVLPQLPSPDQLVVYVTPGPWNINISLTDAQESDWFYAGVELMEESRIEFLLRLSKIGLGSDPSRQVRLSATVRELSGRTSGSMVNPFYEPLTPETFQIVTNPERHDPLSIGFGELMLGWAKLENKNLVAHAPDQRFAMLTFLKGDQALPELYFHAVSRGETMLLDADEQWLTIRCSDPIKANNRIPRDLLGWYLRSISSRGYIGIEDAAQLFVRTNDEQFDIASDAARAVVGQWFHGSKFDLAMYASRDERQKSAAPGAWVALNDQQRQILWDHLNDNGQLSPRPGVEQPRHREASLLFPDGLPEGIRVKFTTNLSKVFFGAYQNLAGRTSVEPMEVGRLAWIDAQHERADIFKDFASQMRVERLLRGEEFVVWYEIDIDGKWYTTGQLKESRPLGEPVSKANFLEILSPEEREEYLAEKARAHETFRNMTEEQKAEYQQSAKPPPPP